MYTLAKIFLAVFVGVGFFGCATPAEENAINLTRETLTQLVNYEDIVRNWNRNSRDVYDRAYADMEKDFLFQTAISSDSRINSLAGDLADIAVERPLRDVEFRGFLTTILEQDQATNLEIMKLINQLREERRKTMSSLKRQEQLLKSTRTKLERLQIEPSGEDRLSQLKPIYEVTKDVFKQVNSSDN